MKHKYRAFIGVLATSSLAVSISASPASAVGVQPLGEPSMVEHIVHEDSGMIADVIGTINAETSRLELTGTISFPDPDANCIGTCIVVGELVAEAAISGDAICASATIYGAGLPVNSADCAPYEPGQPPRECETECELAGRVGQVTGATICAFSNGQGVPCHGGGFVGNQIAERWCEAIHCPPYHECTAEATFEGNWDWGTGPDEPTGFSILDIDCNLSVDGFWGYIVVERKQGVSWTEYARSREVLYNQRENGDTCVNIDYCHTDWSIFLTKPGCYREHHYAHVQWTWTRTGETYLIYRDALTEEHCISTSLTPGDSDLGVAVPRPPLSF